MSLINASTLKRARGFTLIEVLVSLLVLAIGLLGLAALQTQGVRFNHDAATRTQATNLANDLLERMRIERIRLQQLEDAVDGDQDIFPDQLSQFVTANFPAAPYTNVNCNPLGTTVTAQMYCWLLQVTEQLPSGSALVSQQAADLNALDVTLRWVDRDARDFGGTTRLPQNQAECEARAMRQWAAPNCLVIQTWTVRP